MIPYTEFISSPRINYIPVKSSRGLYDDNIYSLDIETSSVFIKDGVITGFDESLPPIWYTGCIKCGYMYIWQFSINDVVYYGRTWNELEQFLRVLGSYSKGMLIVYVHNLAFEFQFLLNFITDFLVFAREPRHPIVARSKEYNVEFRCSLMLTQTALADVPKIFSLPVEKLVGDLDYLLVRHSGTPLTAKELDYCEHDCLVVYELIKNFKLEYKHVYSIPLTQTGRIRRKCQRVYKRNARYHRSLRKQLPTTAAEFKMIMDVFAGGYTHANYYYASTVIENVNSRDIASSYPAVIVAEKYPCSHFVSSRVKRFEEIDNRYLYILDITFYGLSSKTYNHFLSYNRTLEKYNCEVDNGRIVGAEKVRCKLTSVDLAIVEACYWMNSYIINAAYRATKNYLDIELIKIICNLYQEKTRLKGLPEYKKEYMIHKQFINSIYGMMVTNVITDTVEFQSGQPIQEWLVTALPEQVMVEKLLQIQKDPKTFLNPSWGIFVTAYARRALWDIILQLDEDIIYCDTDSVKYINNHDPIFEKYNRGITFKIRQALAYHGLPLDSLSPVDSSGQARPIGIYENDGYYDRFISLGAKKYCVERQGRLELTVSGISRTSGVTALKSIDDFKTGFVFDYAKSGRKVLTYNDMQPKDVVLTDYLGHSIIENSQYGICLQPTTYTLGISAEYGTYLNSTVHYHDERYAHEAKVL